MIKRILINRAEGPVAACAEIALFSLGEAEQHLKAESYTAPKGGGYDKCDVTVEFADGQLHEIRFDLTADFVLGDLADALKRDAQFWAGLWRPERMTAEQHASYIAEFPPAVRAALTTIAGRY